MKTFELETLTYGTIGEQEVQVAKKKNLHIFFDKQELFKV